LSKLLVSEKYGNADRNTLLRTGLGGQSKFPETLGTDVAKNSKHKHLLNDAVGPQAKVKISTNRRYVSTFIHIMLSVEISIGWRGGWEHEISPSHIPTRLPSSHFNLDELIRLNDRFSLIDAQL
jgi:hypothetical protein